MEYGGGGAEQAQIGFEFTQAVKRKICGERPSPPGPGQVVSGRAAAALVAVLLLEEGRRAALERCGTVRRRKRELRRDRDAGCAFPAHPGGEARARSGARLSRPRGYLVLPVARAQAARERRSARLAPGRSARARAPAQIVSRGLRQ